MSKVIHCAKVVPESGCPHSIGGATEEELLRNAAQHAKEHGIVEVTPELIDHIKANIEDD
jgi:predicted small metal-binding protein